jgi:Domain of unknown function (DUF4266)
MLHAASLRRAFTISLLSASLCACSGLPKVEAWEKGALAKPAMALNADPLDSLLMQHIYQSKEAAAGGYGVGGGGCGCN